ncbi:MAG: heparan-alpha-glucosaminide N-acetyltransferase domain-containing protein, partial [Acidobacteriota bacterium]|nr:heparan-alpha-glucosaminide N-acetyltransferase domain-containing protein [Acidobacteriota bacterium]
MPEQTKSSGRLAFIDWTRGFAAVIMLQGHVFDSFTRTDLRDKGPFILSQFLGGMPPAIFLFLTGITFAFLMDSQDRRGAKPWARVVAALKRSRYLFLIAFLFRIQLYVFGFPTSPAGELLRVDILNCMGMAMLILAPMAVFTTLERIRLCTI